MPAYYDASIITAKWTANAPIRNEINYVLYEFVKRLKNIEDKDKFIDDFIKEYEKE